MKRKFALYAWICFLLSLPGVSYCQTTTVTIPATGGTALPNGGRFGLVMGGSGNYGQGQLLKDFGAINGAYMPQVVYNMSFYCNSGGTTNTTTSWYSANYGTGAYPANFFAGFPYTAYSQAGTILGTGTVSASTSNIGSSGGITFTLGTAMSAACATGSNTSIQDVIVIGPVTGKTLTPAQTFENPPSSATFDTSDVPSGVGAVQSLVLPSGVSFDDWTDRIIPTGSSLTGSAVPPFVNLNGTYTSTYWAKAVSGTTTATKTVARIGGSNLANNTDSLTTTWQQFTHTFTAAEAGSQSQQLLSDTVTCAASCKIWGATLIEGSTLSGNTTPFRDAVVQKLQAYKPGVLRFMNPSDWCSTVTDMIASDSNRRLCGMKNSSLTNLNYTYGYQDDFLLAQFLGTDIWIDMSKVPTAADATLLMQFIGGPSTTTGGAVRAAQGTSSPWTTLMGSHTIYIELGNEPWNNAADLAFESGNGSAYGALVGPVVAALKASPYYNSSQIKVIQGGQMGSFGSGGFAKNALQAEGCTLTARTSCPDFVDVAPYFAGSAINNLTNNFQDFWVESINFNSLHPSYPGCSYQTTPALWLGQQLLSNCFNVNLDIYEDNISPTGGGSATPTQTQMDQIFDGVGAGLVFGLGKMLQRRDAGIVGPDNGFAFTDSYASGGTNGKVFGAWDATAYMATGPGQIGGSWVDPDKPWGIVEKVMNNAIGSNNYILPTTQSGTPTVNYAANNGVAANSAAALVNCGVFNNNGNNYTGFCFNTDTVAHTVALTGAGAPASGTSVTLTKFGSPTNAITDNNDLSTITNQSTAAPVQTPSPTTTTGSAFSSYSLPAQSMIAMTYTLGSGGGVAAPVISPGTGSYTSQQSVTITDSTGGAVIHYTTDGSVPTSASPTYSSAITVTYSQTINAIAISGGTSSTVTTAVFTMSTGTTATTVTVSHPAVPTYVGDPVTSTINLGNSAATGTVTIRNGTTQIGTITIPVGAGGIGTWTGTYSWNANNINAIYNGDVNYAAQAAVYNGVLVRLNKTNLVLKSSNTSVTSGTSVTFTATISSLTDSGTPTGSIIFYEKGVVLGTSALSSGVATYSTSSLGVGEHYIQAVYVGDRSNYDQTQSLWVDQTIRPTTAVPCQINYAGSLTGYTVYYVAPTGSDSAAGTCAAPFQTMAHATSLVTGAGFAILGQAGASFKEIVKVPAGTSAKPNILDSYGTGPYPTAEGADTPSLTWSLVSGSTNTYQAAYTGYPYKAFVDSVGQDSTPVLPTFNWIGNCGSAAANPYDTCFNTANSNTYSRILPSAGGAFNANNQSWGLIPSLPTSMQTTGLLNVQALPGTLYANGTNLYMHLSDGSNPSSHTIQITTRKYGIDQRNTSYVTVNHWNAAHPAFDGFLNKATTAGTTNANITFGAVNAYNCGTIYGYDYPNEGDFFVGCVEVNSSEIAGDTTSIQSPVLGPNLHFGSVDTWYGLDINNQGIGIHGASNLILTGVTGSAVNAEDIDFGQDSFAAAPNSNLVVGGGTTQADSRAVVLTNGQSGIRVSNITTGTFQNIIVHDTLGFGDQCGGSSTNVTESYFLEYNIRATTGRQDYLTDFVPGGGGSLFNAGDGNGGCTNLVKTHVTTYNVSAGGQTLENGSPYAVNATLKFNLYDNAIGVRPDNTILTTGNGTSGDYILLNRFESQPQAAGSWTGNFFIPQSLQIAAFNWSNSSDGDHATLFSQMDVNTGGGGNIFSTTDPWSSTGASTTSFALPAGSPGLGNSGDPAAANPGYDQTTGTSTACGTPSAISVAEAYPNQTQFGFNTVAVGHYAAFKAVATCSDGSQRSISPASVTWTASAPSSASIATTTVTTASPIRGATAANGTFGLMTGLVCCGASNVTATYGGVTSPAYSMTVTAGTPLPVASPAAGSYSSAQSVTLTTTDSSAVIYYTLDGSTPTISSTQYTGPIPISTSKTINAIGYNASGPYTSAVASFAYTITTTPVTANPTFAPTPGTYTSSQSVLLMDATSGATIYFTTDGSTPTTSSAIYSSAIPVTSTTTIKAIAQAPGSSVSGVSTGLYTISLPAATPPCLLTGTIAVSGTVKLQ